MTTPQIRSRPIRFTASITSLDGVEFALMTKTTASHRGDNNAVSERESTGGESRMTQSKLSAAVFSMRSNSFELSNSEGFDGSGPDGRKQNSGFVEMSRAF